MSEEFLSVQDVLKIIRRHLLLIVLTIIACEAISIGLARTLPKKYKTSALLNLKSSYFEIPGVGDGLSYAEVQSQKQALLRLALDDTFMDKVGTKYGLLKSEEGTSARESEREGLRKKIDFLTSSATTFRITAIGQTAAIAYGMASDTLDQIVEVLARERHRTLSLHRESLMKQLESMGVTAPTGGAGGGGAGGLATEVRRAQKRLDLLRSQYTADHPRVLEAETRLRELRHEQDQHGGSVPVERDSRSGSLTIDSSQKDKRTDFGEELLKKINYLDIALELEKDKDQLYFEVLERPLLPDSYIFPNTLAFAVGGFFAGFLLAAVAIALLELRRASVLTPVMMSRQLGLPLIGSLPSMIPRGLPEGPRHGRSHPD